MEKQLEAVVTLDKPTFAVGERVEKFCVKCGEERGHVISSLNKRGKISRVRCPKCDTLGTFKSAAITGGSGREVKAGAPYDRTRAYRTGQTMLHPIFGAGEVMGVIEPQKIDVLFSDRMRRLIHSQTV